MICDDILYDADLNTVAKDVIGEFREAVTLEMVINSYIFDKFLEQSKENVLNKIYDYHLNKGIDNGKISEMCTRTPMGSLKERTWEQLKMEVDGKMRTSPRREKTMRQKQSNEIIEQKVREYLEMGHSVLEVSKKLNIQESTIRNTIKEG